MGGFKERDPHRGITGAADGAGSIGLAGLIAPRRQAEAWPNRLGGGEAFRSVDGGTEGQGHDRADTRHGHQPVTDRVFSCRVPDPLFQHRELVA